MKTILLCNDDGVQAPGLSAMSRAVDGLATVNIVAPDSERSAISHGITLTKPLYIRPYDREGRFFGTAVSGTPADCVKLAVSELLSAAPDFVLSGINLGPNAGISVLYSGTVGAATEGVLLGVPSMAVSLDTFANPEWETAVRVTRHLVTQLLKQKVAIAPDSFWNVNIPNLPYEQLRGLRITRMGASRFVETYERRHDPWGNPYFWMTGEHRVLGDQTGTDLEALQEGYVSITPIGLDHTDHPALGSIDLAPLPA